MVDFGLLNFELLTEERISRASTLQLLRKELIDSLNGVLSPDPIPVIPNSHELFDEAFLKLYRSKNLINFVQIENFREDTK